MNRMIAATTALGVVWFAAGAAEASVFSGYTETSNVFFDGAAEFDYLPFQFDGAIYDTAPSSVVNIALADDLSGGSLTILTPELEGSLVESLLQSDAGARDDSFSMLFELSPGSGAYAIATFTGDLDGSGLSDFFTVGVEFAPGSLRIVGATREPGIIPLPAGIVLLGSGLAGLGLLRARRF